MSFDFDPRWTDDPRDRDSARPDLGRGGGGDDWRDRDQRDRDLTNPRDLFHKGLDLPRGLEREPVHVGGRDYELRGSEVRSLATVGAFRVVPASDLSDHRDRSADPHRGDLRHLRDAGLIRTVPVEGGRHVVVLTNRGRDLLDAARRDRTQESRQTFYAGLTKPRELSHDSQVYRAYLRSAERLRDQGAHVHRVVLDYELKREYQQFLQKHNRGRPDSDGRPDRSREEIALWAAEHDLPCNDGHVQFPDVRIEYQDADGRWHVDDIEVMTHHYRGAHAASKSGSGFTGFGGSSRRIGASTGRGGRSLDPRFAERFL